MLLNLVNPSAEIREGFENYALITHEGRVLNGFLIEQDERSVTLRSTEGRAVVVDRANVEELRKLNLSLMPEGLLAPLGDQEVRDLFAYLRISQPLVPR